MENKRLPASSVGGVKRTGSSFMTHTGYGGYTVNVYKDCIFIHIHGTNHIAPLSYSLSKEAVLGALKPAVEEAFAVWSAMEEEDNDDDK